MWRPSPLQGDGGNNNEGGKGLPLIKRREKMIKCGYRKDPSYTGTVRMKVCKSDEGFFSHSFGAETTTDYEWRPEWDNFRPLSREPLIGWGAWEQVEQWITPWGCSIWYFTRMVESQPPA